jgi:hypothetical protein
MRTNISTIRLELENDRPQPVQCGGSRLGCWSQPWPAAGPPPRYTMVRFDELDLVVRETGALGMSTAHSSDIAGLLFEQRDPDLEQRCELAQRMLRDTGFDEQWRFDTDD